MSLTFTCARMQILRLEYIIIFSTVGIFCCWYLKEHVWFKFHDDVIKWKHFPRNWPFVRGIHRSPVNSPHKGQWRGALMHSLICVWINDWVNNSEAGDLRRYRIHYDVTVMLNRCGFDEAISKQNPLKLFRNAYENSAIRIFLNNVDTSFWGNNDAVIGKRIYNNI